MTPTHADIQTKFEAAADARLSGALDESLRLLQTAREWLRDAATDRVAAADVYLSFDAFDRYLNGASSAVLAGEYEAADRELFDAITTGQHLALVVLGR